MSKSILLISRSAPYGSNAAREFLDIALAASVFEQPVTLLLLDDGVFQVLGQHQPENVGQKNLQAVQRSLELYEIDCIHVDLDSANHRGITDTDLPSYVRTINTDAVQTLIHEHDVVLTI